MSKVSLSELRKRLDYYIGLSITEDIVITKRGKVIAVLSSPDKKYYETLLRLCGCLKNSDTNEDYKDIIGAEIIKRC